MKTKQWQNRNLNCARNGFSLVEIMMVLMLIGLMAGISAPPMFKYLASNQMQTRTDRMVADLQYARAVSIASGQAHRFASTTTSYTLTNLVTGIEVRNVTFDHGAELAMMQFSDFFPWGMASSTTFNLSQSDMQRRIILLPTGMVEVQSI